MGPCAPALASFDDALGSCFQVHLDDATAADVTLAEVTATPHRDAGWESFSLVFAGTRPAFHQATYDVTHPALGSFPLFLVPVVTDGDAQHYQAIFNRPIP